MVVSEKKTPRFLNIPPRPKPNPPAHNNDHEEDLELDESDVVWSSTTTTTTQDTSTATTNSGFHHPSAGISAALFASSPPPNSPTSLQRYKTTTSSSPISMIPSGGPGPALYGRKFQFQPKSAPVNVPFWPNKKEDWLGLGQFDNGNGLYDDDDDEMVPPHEMVARSQRTTTFSVMEGVGRTLKGRDLTAVRNAVFQRTGFL